MHPERKSLRCLLQAERKTKQTKAYIKHLGKNKAVSKKKHLVTLHLLTNHWHCFLRPTGKGLEIAFP